MNLEQSSSAATHEPSPPVDVARDPKVWILATTSGKWHRIGKSFRRIRRACAEGVEVVCGWRVQVAPSCGRVSKNAPTDCRMCGFFHAKAAREEARARYDRDARSPVLPITRITLRSFADRMARPCVDCQGPIGRSHLKAKRCFACWKKKHEHSHGGARARSMTRSILREILEAVTLDPERCEPLAASLEAGETLRMFLCACRRLYIGANRNRCDHCSAHPEEL